MAIHATCVQRPDSTFPVVVKPYKLDISQFGERVRDKMKFTIRNVSDQAVSLQLIADLRGLAEIDLPEKIEAGRSASGEVRIHADRLEEEFEKSFTFQLDDEAGTRFTIPVKRSIKKPTAVGDKTSADKTGSK